MISNESAINRPMLHPTAPSACDEEEINLFEYILILIRYKALIMTVVAIAGLSAVVYSLMLTNIYRSEATIALRDSDKGASPLSAFGGLGGMVASSLGLGGGGSLEKLEVVLKSRELSARVINTYDLMPTLFSKTWDPEKKKWRTDAPPSLQDALRVLADKLSIRADIKKNTLTVGIEYKDPEMAKTLVNHFLTELSNSLREEVLRDAAENMRFFNEQLQRTGDAMLREKIYALMAKEVEKETFAKAQKYYSFLVLDPPIAPDLDKKIRPKRSTICILAVLMAFTGSIMAAFAIDFIKKVKVEDPERYRQVMEGLKWHRSSASNYKHS